MPIQVAAVYRYPVKGLSAESLARVELVAGRGIAGDRRFALTAAAAVASPSPWMPKETFLTLMRHEKLATLETRFDDATATLVVRRGGRDVARGRIDTPMGRAVIEDFFAAYLRGQVHGQPRLVAAADGEAFADHPQPLVSVINLASVRDIERVVGAAVDPLRFRGNIYISGCELWAEAGWIGRHLAIGEVRLEVVETIERCAATNVNPSVGSRDLNIPQALQRGFGHVECGVLARVVSGGPIAVGDAVQIG